MEKCKLENPPEDNQAGCRNRKMADHEASIESTKLLTILPKEIWMQIFYNIFQPEDLNILQKSSSFFDKVLENQKTRTLFPEVIKILAAQRANYPSYEFGAHGKIAKHLLNCRLVCRTWQIGVDTALQNFSNSGKLLDVACRQGLSILPESRDAHFSLQEQPATFLQNFDREYAAKNRNPFIGRSLYFHVSTDLIRDMDYFFQQLLQILVIYGHHVWSFSFYIGSRGLFQEYDPRIETVWYYERLRNFLQHMPNLRELKLKFGRSFSEDNWVALGLRLKSFVFPELKDLAYLQMDIVPTPVFDALLRRYSHVKMFSSHAMSGTSDRLMYTHSLPNVTQIALSVTDFNRPIQWNTSMALWPLKNLIIRLEIFELQFDWQSLFQFLETRWAATLTELKIDFKYAHGHIHPSQVLPSLKLKNLKEFVFYSYVLVPLDFLLPTKNSLERLVVQYTPFVDAAQVDPEFELGREIQFYKFRRNLDCSNIWSLFPNLNTVEFYDRLILEQLCRRPVSMM